MYKLHMINSLEERKKHLNSLSSKEKESLLKFYGFENVSWNLFYFSATSLKEELLKLELELENLQAQANDMKLEIDKLKDPTYLEKYVTEKYIYKKDEEYIIKTP